MVGYNHQAYQREWDEHYRKEKEKNDEIDRLYAKPWLADAVDFYLCKKSNFAHKIQELLTK